MRLAALLLLCALLAAAAACARTFSGSPLLDQAVELAIADGRIPGAVLLVGHKGKPTTGIHGQFEYVRREQ